MNGYWYNGVWYPQGQGPMPHYSAPVTYSKWGFRVFVGMMIVIGVGVLIADSFVS